MKRFAITLALTLTLAIAATAALVPGAETPQAMIDEINSILSSAEYEGVIAIHVEQRNPARPLFSLNSDRGMTPASNNKLQTTASALHFLGADHTRTTRLLTNGEVDENGCLRGDLIVVGDGDPGISGRYNGGNILETMENWAQTLKRDFGVRSIDGDIIGDDDLFDDSAIEQTWFLDELGEWYSAETCALSFNDNCVDIEWVAAPIVGNPPRFTLNPQTDYLNVINRVSTLAADADTDRYYHREFESNQVMVDGGIALGRTIEDSAAVHNPTLYFTTVLRDTLRRRGVTLTGHPRDIDDLSRAAVMHDLTEIDSVTSQPISVIIDTINQYSQNFYADMVLKLIGAEVADEGSFDAGAEAVRQFLGEIGALPEGDTWQMIDGSGLSWQNTTTPQCLCSLLRHMDTRPDAAIFRASLPHGRADRGSLRNRFGQSERSRAVGTQILGKTGYIDGVWSLTGIARNQAGVEMYYSIMLNDFSSQSVRATRLIDDIVVAVAASTFGADAHLDPQASLH